MADYLVSQLKAVSKTNSRLSAVGYSDSSKLVVVCSQIFKLKTKMPQQKKNSPEVVYPRINLLLN
jgi:hypothetical protein